MSSHWNLELVVGGAEKTVECKGEKSRPETSDSQPQENVATNPVPAFFCLIKQRSMKPAFAPCLKNVKQSEPITYSMHIANFFAKIYGVSIIVDYNIEIADILTLSTLSTT